MRRNSRRGGRLRRKGRFRMKTTGRVIVRVRGKNVRMGVGIRWNYRCGEISGRRPGEM